MLSIRCRKLKTKLDIVHESEKICLGLTSVRISKYKSCVVYTEAVARLWIGRTDGHIGHLRNVCAAMQQSTLGCKISNSFISWEHTASPLSVNRATADSTSVLLFQPEGKNFRLLTYKLKSLKAYLWIIREKREWRPLLHNVTMVTHFS